MPEISSDAARSEGARVETGRTRSPNYPSVSLGEAINRARLIYEKEHTHKASAETVAQDMGYSSLNGTSRTTISALKKYGLLQADGDGVKITSDAVDILELPASDPTSVEARRRAAFKPALFSEFKEAYGDRLPSDTNLRHSLIKRGFNPRMASEVIQIYKDTVDSIGHSAAPVAPPTTTNTEVHEDKHDSPRVPSTTQTAVSAQSNVLPQIPAQIPTTFVTGDGGWSESLEFRVGGSKVRLLFEGKVTQEGIEKLIKLLAISKDEYPTAALLKSQEIEPKILLSQNSQPTAPTHPEKYDSLRPAIWHDKEADFEVSIAGFAGNKEGKDYYFTDTGTGILANEVQFLDDLEDEE